MQKAYTIVVNIKVILTEMKLQRDSYTCMADDILAKQSSDVYNSCNPKCVFQLSFATAN